ncbi:hypothetical protein [Aquirufa sp.]|jgi:hypothetical protein|uniref:hypothetical protein n=1 Tax=Aquirufa sp. TaxID=2676249 RepID=UPI0037C067FD
MIQRSFSRTFISLFLGGFIALGLSGCWSARCPRETCRVRVEHRHGEKYFRPHEAFSWMWTPRYKHVRSVSYAELANKTSKPKRIWNRIFKPTPKVSAQKPR